METFVEAIVCLLLLVGSLFTLIGAVGLARLPDFFMRLHGPTKSTTLACGRHRARVGGVFQRA
ncbi:monovalent cation/proton antiporter MnhG/PhaG subunit [Paraburkholderia atlantica]